MMDKHKLSPQFPVQGTPTEKREQRWKWMEGKDSHAFDVDCCCCSLLYDSLRLFCLEEFLLKEFIHKRRRRLSSQKHAAAARSFIEWETKIISLASRRKSFSIIFSIRPFATVRFNLTNSELFSQKRNQGDSFYLKQHKKAALLKCRK